MERLKSNWHGVVGFILALGIVGLAGGVICSPCLLSLAGLAVLSDFLAETPYALPTLPPIPTARATPPPTPTPTPLALGEYASLEGGLRLAVTQYEATQVCPDGLRQASEGAELILIQVDVENATSDVAVEIPHMVFMLLRNGNIITRDWEADCLYTEDSLGNACWEWGGKLYPGVSCEGWVAFEVPEGMSPEQLVVDGPGGSRWRLEP